MTSLAGQADSLDLNALPRTRDCILQLPIRWEAIDDLDRELGLFPTVFWEPLDTESLRALISGPPSCVAKKSVLEIGTGSGLIALCCAVRGATRVVATDINPNAIQCAQFNANRMRLNIDFRLVPSGPSADSSAYAVLGGQERFDFIISNPPWENAKPAEWSEFALYDSNFTLLDSILRSARDHLTPEGRLLLAYGCVDAVQMVFELARHYDFQVVTLDERDHRNLPDLFLPGMLLGLKPN